MNSSDMLSYFVISSMSDHVRSALPDAPVIAGTSPRWPALRRRLVLMRHRAATVLHKTAWAVEPHPCAHELPIDRGQPEEQP